MKKIFIGLGIVLILLMTIGIVFADMDSIKEDLETKGKKVDNVTEVNSSDLPSQLSIEDIELGTDLAIYEVDIGEDKPIFAITSSGKIFKETPVEEKRDFKKFLDFGFSGEMNESRFLKTTSGIQGDLNKEYVMIKNGSITRISTNLEVINSVNSGRINIIIYKNGEPIRFGNVLNAVSSGMKKDYDIQSKDIVLFKSEDIISVYVEIQGDVVLRNITTLVEITTN